MEITKDMLGSFAEWVFYNCKVLPDGWHYKGEPYSTNELVELWLKQTL